MGYADFLLHMIAQTAQLIVIWFDIGSERQHGGRAFPRLVCLLVHQPGSLQVPAGAPSRIPGHGTVSEHVRDARRG